MSREKEDMYSLLQLEVGADLGEAEQAYRHFALKYHPYNDLESRNPDRFKEISLAFRYICSGIKQYKKEDCDLRLFFDHFENELLSDKSERSVSVVFSPLPLASGCDEMYIDDDDDIDPAERQFDTFVDIIQNSQKSGVSVPEGFSEEKLAELKDDLLDERDAIKRDCKKPGASKAKTPSQVPVSKPKPKSKKQKAAEQRRREQEMEKIADELAKTQKLEEEKAKRREQAEYEKQKKIEEERSRQAAEDRKRKDREERDRVVREKREKEELEARLKEEERLREKEEKKRKQAEAKQKLAEQKAKEEEDKKKKESAAKNAKQQQQQLDKTYPPREVPPRFASKQQQQQQKQQQSPPAQQKTSTSVTSVTTSSETKMMNQANQLKKQNGTASWVSNTSWGSDDVVNRGNSTGSGWNDIESEAHQQRDSPAIGNWSNQGRSNWDAPKQSNEIIVDSKDRQAWPSIDQSEQDDNDNASVKSGSVISSSSNSGQDPPGAITPQSASADWGANTSDASAWPTSASSPRGMNSTGWGSNPLSVSNNQGLNMQTSPNLAGGDNAANPLTTGWGLSVSGPANGSGAGSGRPMNSMQGSAQGDSGSAMWGKPAGWSAANGPGDGKEWGAGDATSGWGAPSPDSVLNSGGWGNPSQNPSPNPNAVSGWGQPNPAPTTTATGWGGATKSQTGATERGNPPPPSQWGAPSSTAISSHTSAWGASPQAQWGAKPVQGELGANVNQPKSQQPSTFAQAAGKGLKPPMPSPAEQARLQQEMEKKRAITSNDGWGATTVRQDTAWAAAESPETKRKVEDPTVWNHTANTGTAIWESTKKPTSGVITSPSDWDAPDIDDPKVWRNPDQGNGAAWKERREHKTSTSSWGDPPNTQSPQPLTNNTNVWGAVADAKDRQETGSSWGAAPEKPSGSWSSAPEKPPSSSWGAAPAKPPGGSWGPPPTPVESQGMWGSSLKDKTEGWDEPLPGGERPSNIDDGTAVWGNPDVKSHSTPQNWSNPSTPSTPMTPSSGGRGSDDIWNSRSGWGDPQPPSKMDGSSMWDSGPNQRGPGSWGDSKPKTPSLGSWSGDSDMTRKMSGDPSGDNDWDTAIDEWNPQGANSSWSSKAGFNNMRRPQHPSMFQGSNNTSMGGGGGGMPPSMKPSYGSNQPHMRSRMIQLLMNLGVSKDQATAAIISNDMNLDNAIAELQQSGALRGDMPPMDIGQFQPPPFSSANTLSSAQFPMNRGPPSINNKQQQHQQQPGMRPGPQGGMPSGTAIRGPGNNSTMMQQQMLRQLQVAIQTGHLNPQILQQQITMPLLVSLQGFLQSYTNERQLTNLLQQISQNKGSYPNARLQYEQYQHQLKVERQKMMQFQQQIQRTTLNPQVASVQKEFNNMTISQDPGAAPKQPKSRLTDWLQHQDKEEGGLGKPSLHQSHSTPNLNPDKPDDSNTSTSGSSWGLPPLGGSRDWSTASSAITSSAAPGSSKETESPISAVVSSLSAVPTTSAVSDIPEIPEFVPGQPWQGFATKNVEEDPTITPGSVLSSRTHSLNTIDSNHLSSLASRASTIADLKTVNSRNSISSELWGAPSKSGLGMQSSRPPPGLLPKSSAGGWGSNSSGSGVGFSRSLSWAPGERSSQMGGSWDGRPLSPWLVLKNLTSQIDENTLRALCSQHGPLLSFINIPNSGQAIVQYSTQEQALKAQKSLNMCMLGNSAMLVDFATEDEVSRLIQVTRAPPPSHSLWAGGPPPRSAGPYGRGGGHWSGGGGGSGSPWGGMGGGSLWGSNFDDPQGMNLIPGGLLGETM